MQNVLKAADEKIGMLECQLAYTRKARDAAESERNALREERSKLRARVGALEQENTKLKKENERLKATLASIPPTLSRAEFEEIHNAPDCIVPAGDVGHDS